MSQMISAASRYANNEVQAVTSGDTVTRNTIMRRVRSSQTVEVVDYIWHEGDRVDVLAARVYGDEALWWVLADSNPEIMDWTHVAAGTAVRIPSGG